MGNHGFTCRRMGQHSPRTSLHLHMPPSMPLVEVGSYAVLQPLTQSREVAAMNGSCPPVSNNTAQEVLPHSWPQVLTGCCILCRVLHHKIQKSILGFAGSRGGIFPVILWAVLVEERDVGLWSQLMTPC